jgi:hypothetical protein
LALAVEGVAERDTEGREPFALVSVVVEAMTAAQALVASVVDEHGQRVAHIP